MIKNITLIIILLSFYNCNSLQNNLVGNWKLSSIINSDNIYVARSSLTPEKVESKMTISLKADGTFISNGDLCTGNWQETKDNNSKGKFYLPKYMNLDKTFRFEADKCPGLGGDHHLKLINEKLELYYPSVTRYRIQIFEKISK
ncbi:hypothetical protein HHL23_16230 [Chryseobacterium sp. RP-3-3]|uniref:Lipocalin-like domain-containing protein n=1 Tax=Chryseobacterium antibioticum TaxID=2728847 RepID=A0A7Y0FSK4_9FLAO|nr:hypothetical protein [Chryseobacterium antibioticum]NML71338.1 hypothetical protein [Chryseobacterium antibioticum]